MRKTTLYLDDDLITKVKLKAIEEPGSSMTKIINDSLRMYLKKEDNNKRSFSALRRALGTSKGFKNVSDPVEYQKKLRSEWE